MNHHFAASWLQSLSGKLEALTSWSLSANRHGSYATHKNLFREFFSAPFQKTLALVDEQKKTEFLGVIEKNLFKFDESTQQFPLGCLCALLLHGKDSPRMQEKVVAWVDFILERLRLRGWERAAVAEVVEECLSAPFQKFLPLMEASLRARLADGLGEHLGRLEEEEQKRVLEQLPVVPARIDEIVAGCTRELNAWLLSAPLYPATPASLADTLMRLEHPLVRLFTVVKDAAKKESFLVAVALALQGLRTRFKWMCAVELGLESVGKELQRRFFTVEGQGPVMELWLSSRLKKYNAEVAARTAGLLVAEPSKLEVLKSRLRPLFPERQGPSGDPGPDSEETAEPERKALEEGWVSLDGPNAVSNTVLVWLMESYPGFFCPQHTLARETLMGVLQRCGRAFETELQGSCARARLGLSEAEPQPPPAMPKDPPPPPKQPLPAPGTLPPSLGQPLPPSLQPRPLLGGPGPGSGIALGQVAAPGLAAPVHVPPPPTLPASSSLTTTSGAAAKAIANATANAAVAGAASSVVAGGASASASAGPSLGQAFGTVGQPLAPWAASARPPAPSAPGSLSLAPLPPAPAPLGSSKALAPAPASASAPASTAAIAAAASSVSSPAPAATVATTPSAAAPEVDNLIDLLLGEALEGLASEVRARIVKLGHGVYRFGSKEVTLHTQNGRLYVNRIGEILKHVPLLTLLQEEGLLTLPPPAAGALLALAAPSIAGAGAGAASTLMAAAKAAGSGGSAASAGALSTSTGVPAAADTSSVARIALQAKQISSGVTTTTTAALQPAPFGLNRSVEQTKSDPQALMSKRVEAATKAMDVSKQIVRRSVNFEDDKLLRRLLSKGLKHDKQWQSSYQEYCSSHGVTEHDQKLQDKDFIATFIEQNLANSINQDWAKKILWSPAEDGDKKEKKEKRGRKEEKKEKKDKTRRRDGIGNSAGKRAASGSSSGSERQALPAQAALGSVVAAPPQTASALEMSVAMPMYAGMPLGMGGMLGPIGQMGGMLGPMGMPMLGDAGMQAMATEHAEYHRSRKKAKKEKAEKSGKSRRN